ncbi:hypothetical protein [Burkholderia mayonis]|uniref:hypothetical protein n=1 Tax=Burkholderia mayonis TaxID=1385591 RepID=UPI00131F370E|nr:hypothetical protein [Burkholderia mayonis]
MIGWMSSCPRGDGSVVVGIRGEACAAGKLVTSERRSARRPARSSLSDEHARKRRDATKRAVTRGAMPGEK